MKDDILAPLRSCALEIGEAVKDHRHLGFSGKRPTQYHLDLVADDVALRVLGAAGFQIVSEESGTSGSGEFTVVVDPIDGSTNCDRGVPFYATSLAVLKNEELVAGLVMNQATGTVFEAEVGSGATRDGAKIRCSEQVNPADALMSFLVFPHAISIGPKLARWGQPVWRFASWLTAHLTCSRWRSVRH